MIQGKILAAARQGSGQWRGIFLHTLKQSLECDTSEPTTIRRARWLQAPISTGVNEIDMAADYFSTFVNYSTCVATSMIQVIW